MNLKDMKENSRGGFQGKKGEGEVIELFYNLKNKRRNLKIRQWFIYSNVFANIPFICLSFPVLELSGD